MHLRERDLRMKLHAECRRRHRRKPDWGTRRPMSRAAARPAAARSPRGAIGRHGRGRAERTCRLPSKPADSSRSRRDPRGSKPTLAPKCSGKHLRAEADAEERRLLLQRHADPVDLGANEVVLVVGAHRPAEDDDAAVVGHASRAAARRSAACGCRGDSRCARTIGPRGPDWNSPGAARSAPVSCRAPRPTGAVSGRRRGLRR